MNSIVVLIPIVFYIIKDIVLVFGGILITLCLCRLLYMFLIEMLLPERIIEKRITKIAFIIGLVIVFVIGVFINVYILDIKFTFYEIPTYFYTFFASISIIDIIILCLYLLFLVVKMTLNLF